MATIPPYLTPEARAAAGAKAVTARRERAAVKAALSEGTIGIFEVINDGRESIQRMRVIELLDAAPGVGPRRTYTLMNKAGISETRRIGGLGSHQLQKLRSEMILNKVPINPGTLIVMSGPGGVGKSTITSFLRNHPAIWISTSVTTREPRENEKDGRDYHFVTEEKFDQLIAQNALLEWAEFAGARYGTPRQPVLDALALGKDVLLEIDIEGAKQVKTNWPDAILVFLEPPSWEELVSRLEGRATDTPERRAERLALAQEEMAQSPFFDHILVNDQVEHVVASLIRLAHSQRS